ncbi:unnamed protein product [Rotaria sordida]|uniref:Uncharacterized protein n=1 Tax=Rotaria sordida TaxID=392033 RepID=A0A813RHT5_9BILA|nr:unnamed protein product [Rotaria sordida]
MTHKFSIVFECALFLILSGNNCQDDGKFSLKLYPNHETTYISDAQVIYPSLADPNDYAIATAPLHTVFIAESTLPGAGLGVFAARRIPKDTYFGPYFGYKHENSLIARKSGYTWMG